MNKTVPIKQEYKQSPLGLIPNDWEVKKISDVADIKGGFAFDSFKFKSTGKYQVVKMSNLYENNLDLGRSASFLTEISQQEKDSLPRNGEIVITLTRTVGKRDYGYSFQISTEENLLLNQRVAKIVTVKIDSKYLYYEIKTNRFLNQFFYTARGGTGNQANVGTTDLAAIKIFYPPLPEQKAIAHILGLMDTAINQNNQLIAQKELRKKWLMQNLLTGKKRLKGFSGVWKEYKLDYFIEDYNEKPKEANNYEVLTSAKTGLMKQTDYYGDNRITNREDADYNVIPPNYLTYRSRSDDGLFTFNKNTLGITGLISGYYPVFTIKNGDLDFVLMYCNYYRQQLTKYSIGTSQLVLSMNALKSANFTFPLFEEQTAITQLLQAAIKEIQLLKTKTEKLREQKKGMMQQLLTGKKD